MKMRVSGITTDFKALCCEKDLLLVPTKFYHCLLIICQVKVTDSSISFFLNIREEQGNNDIILEIVIDCAKFFSSNEH